MGGGQQPQKEGPEAAASSRLCFLGAQGWCFLCVERSSEQAGWGGQKYPYILPGCPVAGCAGLGSEDLVGRGRGHANPQHHSLVGPPEHPRNVAGAECPHLFCQDLKPACRPASPVAGGRTPPLAPRTPLPAQLSHHGHMGWWPAGAGHTWTWVPPPAAPSHALAQPLSLCVPRPFHPGNGAIGLAVTEKPMHVIASKGPPGAE